MDEEILRQLLASQDDAGMSPTAEMMMMGSGVDDDLDSIDPALLAALQQQQTQSMLVNPPTIHSRITEVNADDDDDDDAILERIVALKEMFPERIQNAVGFMNSTVVNTTKFACSKGRTAAWWYAFKLNTCASLIVDNLCLY
jgi:hypothetical protein